MALSLTDIREDGEHNGVGFVEISNIWLCRIHFYIWNATIWQNSNEMVHLNHHSVIFKQVYLAATSFMINQPTNLRKRLSAGEYWVSGGQQWLSTHTRMNIFWVDTDSKYILMSAQNRSNWKTGCIKLDILLNIRTYRCMQPCT